ncbi:hypothetical protein [Streptomyces sp. R35]|uniref:Oxidoreductase n=1 Tax=Streptomyces sp. R35 TaxID=3238630 RepID=A0AB39RYB9_9ACTN
MADLVQLLIDHVVRGELLDLAAGAAVHEAAMRSWGEERTIPAAALRDILRGRLASDPDPHGLRLRGARITGPLDLENLTTSVALELYSCLLTEGLVASDAHLPVLVLADCLLEHPDQPPLNAQRLTATVISLTSTTVIAAAETGAVLLADARIRGDLNCSEAKLHNPKGPALNATRMQIEGAVYLNGGFEATGGGDRGAVLLADARIGDDLDCSEARLHNPEGPALNAECLQIKNSVFMTGGFKATGAGTLGAVRLLRARIGGQLDCTGAKFRNPTGPALHAVNLRSEQVVFLRNGFEATGSGPRGAVRLPRGRIRTSLDCSGATLSNDNGPALEAVGLQIGQDLILGNGFEASGSGTGVTLDLTSVRVGGPFEFAPRHLRHNDPSHRLALDGLEFPGLPTESWHIWLKLIREATPVYAAQPYRQLAAVHKAAGHDRDVRNVLIAQRRDQLHRAVASRGERAWGRFTWLTLGYGYQTWRALLGLLAAAALAIILAALGPGNHGGLARTKTTGTVSTSAAAAGTPCAWTDRVGVGLDLGLPLIATGARNRCDVTDTTTGHALALSGWSLQVIAWAFATLFIAGYTSAVRKV